VVNEQLGQVRDWPQGGKHELSSQWVVTLAQFNYRNGCSSWTI